VSEHSTALDSTGSPVPQPESDRPQKALALTEEEYKRVLARQYKKGKKLIERRERL